MLYRDDTGDRLTNVAISRAKGKIVFVGDWDFIYNRMQVKCANGLRNFLRGQGTEFHHVDYPTPE